MVPTDQQPHLLATSLQPRTRAVALRRWVMDDVDVGPTKVNGEMVNVTGGEPAMNRGNYTT